MAIKFTAQDLDEIRTRLSIKTVVGQFVALKRRAPHDYWGLSPFKTEKSPSFHVRDDKGFYHCFATGEHGDIFTFWMHQKRCTFPEAVEALAQQAGVKLAMRGEAASPQAAARARDLQWLAAAAQFYQQQLKTSPLAIEYCKKRGLTGTTAAAFGLGYAPDDWGALCQHLQAQGAKPADLVQLGLAVEGGRQGVYDRFRGRLMFPIHDLKGRVIAFGGRVLGAGEPKYLNSADSEHFHKGQTLYNLHRAYEAMRQTGQAVLVEGYMDVIGLVQAGLPGVVAPLGTAVTAEQIKLLWRYCPLPTVCLDGDAAGYAAAARLARRILPALQPGHSLQFAWLAGGDDPDSFVRRQGLPAFLQVLQQPEPLEAVLWRSLCQDHDLSTAAGRSGLSQEISQVSAEVSNGTVRPQLERALKDRLWQHTRPQAARQSGAASVANHQRGQLPPAEAILGLVLAHPSLLLQFEEEFARLSFPTPELNMLRQKILQLFLQFGVASAPWTPHLTEVGLETLANRLQQQVQSKILDPQPTPHSLRAYWVAYYDALDKAAQRGQGVATLRAVAENPSRAALVALNASLLGQKNKRNSE